MNNQKTFFIYTLSCPKTGAVRYVGATSKTPRNRLAGHKFDAKRHNSSPVQKWVNSLLDEGLEPIMEIIDSGNANTWSDKEKYWIQHYKDAGYDLTNSTDGGRYCEHSEETRRKISEATSGENHYLYGKSLSIEHRRKISETSPKRRPIIQYTKDGIFIRNWSGAVEAEYELSHESIHQSHITACCKGTRKSAGGYIWRYATDPIPQLECRYERGVIKGDGDDR